MIFTFFPQLKIWIFLFIFLCAVIFSALTFFFPKTYERTLDYLNERYGIFAAFENMHDGHKDYNDDYDVDDSDYAYDDYDNSYDYDLSR